ncbi:nuclear transport factor 2 family protein [Sphingobium sp. CR2-8]|uniref:nuclear transport factor 2 family protein n=1 Tax=Sphingobium sp. CR2-8 TaxID=1306534 RepID=UPI002DBF629C|nr:nuclear transport factor 2 family protein [Sphingobium sp. CR2-8]MEC3909523.1 nuclear transport factor 2 family protein [Sphingobium sp. CR2-8]
MADEKLIETLYDKQALADNLMQYCRAVDRMDVDLMKSTYWPDGTDDHGRFRGNAHDWCDEAIRAKTKLINSNHHVSNVYSELSGDFAKREAMFLVVTTYRDHSSAMFLGGRYRDLCEKRDGIWKVLHRVCVWDWNREIEAKPGWHLMSAPEISNWGQFFPDDPIYQDWRLSPQTSAAASGRAEVSAWRAAAS